MNNASTIENRPIIGVTGATGLLGRRVVCRFIEQGYHVVSYVRQRDQLMYNPRYYSEVQGDLADDCQLEDFVRQIDVCIHLAAHVGHGTYRDYRTVNVEGTQLLCELIAKFNPHCRLVYCSSIATLRYPQWFPWLATKYARSKRQAEMLVKEYAKNKNLKAVTIYPGMIYGPGDRKFVPTIISKLKQGKLFLVGGGEKNAPLIHVDDLAELFYLAAIKREAVGQEYIGVKSGDIGIHRFIEMIAEAVNAPRPRLKIPKWLLQPVAMLWEGLYSLVGVKRLPPISRRIVDVLSINFTKNSAEANTRLGWQPKMDVERGLRQMLSQMELYDAAAGYDARHKSPQVNA